MADWIKKAKLKEGAFTTKARAKGESVKRYASDVIKKYGDGKWRKASNPKSALKTYRQALLARAFEKMGKTR